VLELHDRVIGPAGTDWVRRQLASLGFEVDQILSSPEHLVLRRTAPDERTLDPGSSD
jgi:hypothetical protein